MSDDADKAQIHEAAFLARSLAGAKSAAGPEPVIINGVACCAECEAEIPPARLAAMPGVGLCVACQEELEKGGLEQGELDEEEE